MKSDCIVEAVLALDRSAVSGAYLFVTMPETGSHGASDKNNENIGSNGYPHYNATKSVCSMICRAKTGKKAYKKNETYILGGSKECPLI